MIIGKVLRTNLALEKILNDDVSLATLYSAVDLTVVPSKQEGLSNVIMENLSCSTSVVAFDIEVIQI